MYHAPRLQVGSVPSLCLFLAACPDLCRCSFAPVATLPACQGKDYFPLSWLQALCLSLVVRVGRPFVGSGLPVVAVVLAHGGCVGTLRYTFPFGLAAPRLRLRGSIRHKAGQERLLLTDIISAKRAGATACSLTAFRRL